MITGCRTFFIDTTELNFQLGELATIVNSRLKFRRNPKAESDAPLVLDGEDLELQGVILNDAYLNPGQFEITENTLIIPDVPDQFELQCTTLVKPQNNTTLEGLYKSSGRFCTQCEAEGFRKITYFMDRPDVMSVFTVTILADRNKYPVLLSNGNLEESGDLESGGMHWVRWHDPHKKPAYLFALVAGELRYREDYFITMSGRKVTLRIYVDQKDLTKVEHAMLSLKNAMKWDEQRYGREYDLDMYMIVAVDDFNMGAMENKGLNIFNTSCVLANSETTTDVGFKRVESVVAHEYFHNWSGNRVTCRDWFQLSLKEGFTVFRDAQFSADVGSRVVKRIEDATLIRTQQFAEDASPMAHPVQPESYMEISNFYTLTVYEKGAEVVRMIYSLLGPRRFRKGADIYFSSYDGQAVTIEEFIASMEAASGKDLFQFRRWYTQAGTPTLAVRDRYDPKTQTYTLAFKQTCPPTPERFDKEPFHIPIRTALLGKKGPMAMQMKGEPIPAEGKERRERMLEVVAEQQKFVFENIPEKPVPSILRNFSAPVRLDYPYSRDDLMFMMTNDTDGFNRWEASQQLGLKVIKGLIVQHQAGKPFVMDQKLLMAYMHVLQDRSLDPAIVALMLNLPSEEFIAEQMKVVDVDAIHLARQFARKKLAQELSNTFLEIYQLNQDLGIYRPSAESIAQRSLKNTALSYLMLLEIKQLAEVCLDQYNKSTNMTDISAAMVSLINCEAYFLDNAKEKALRMFYRRWQNETLVVNHWLAVQAGCNLPGTIKVVKELEKTRVF